MSLKILPEDRRPKLKVLLNEKGFVRIIECHNGISGLIGERSKVNEKEFDGLWISSLTDSVAKGHPDEEIVSVDSRLDTINQVLNVTEKPIIFDGDTGGFPEQLSHLIRQLEKLGVSAIVLEDKKYPKSNSLLKNAKHNMEDIDLFAEKIRIAKETQKTKEFMVIGRIESFIVGESKEKALWRAKAYLDAGADGIMIHSKSSKADEILDFAKVYTKEFKNKKPLMCVPTTYHGVKEEELINSGFNIVLYANHLMRASFVAMNKVCEKILEHSRGSEAEELCASLKDLLEPVGSVRTFKAEYEG